MIKHFCDECQSELEKRFAPHGREVEVTLNSDLAYTIKLTIKREATAANNYMLCQNCYDELLKRALEKLDELVEQARLDES